MGTEVQTITGGLLMLQLTEEELGEIIELTEEMCTRNGWVNEIVPPAKKRMEIIARARSRPHPAPAQQRIDAAIKELSEARCAGTMEDIDGHIDEAIALLKAGEP
jgi:hypothetical protein